MLKIHIPEKQSQELMNSIIALKGLVYDENHLGTVVRLMEQTTSFDKDLDKLLISRGLNPNDKKGIPEWHMLVGSTSESRKIDPQSRALILGGIKAFVERFIRDNKLTKVLTRTSELND